MSDQVPFQIIKSIEQKFKEYSGSYDAKIKDCLKRGKITEIDFIESEINLFELCLHDLENMSASLEDSYQLNPQTFRALANHILFTDYNDFVRITQKKIEFLKSLTPNEVTDHKDFSSDKPLIPATNCGNLSNTMLVKSPPSSNIIFKGACSSPKYNVCSIHQSNSSSFIPFQA